MPRSEKIRLANDIVSNDSTLESLREKIISLHDTYIELSRKKWNACIVKKGFP